MRRSVRKVTPGIRMIEPLKNPKTQVDYYKAS